MERLILLRHAKAEVDAASGRDFDRALTERGRRDAALIGQTLAEAGFSPDLALVSSAVRATQTWEAAAPFFPGARVERVPALYHIEPDGILTLARAQGAHANTVLVVGHNPGLGQLAALMAQDSVAPSDVKMRLVQGFPTAAAAVIPLDGSAVQMFAPKGLGGGA